MALDTDLVACDMPMLCAYGPQHTGPCRTGLELLLLGLFDELRDALRQAGIEVEV